MAHARSTILILVASCSGTLTGEPDEGSLPGDDEPVDATALRLQIDEPPRGLMLSSDLGPTVHVAGRVIAPRSGDRLTVAGVEIVLDEGGTFATDMTVEKGLNVILAELTDSAGVTLRAQRSVLYGDFLPPDDLVRSAVALRINREGFDDNDPELDDLSSLVEESLAARNLINIMPTSYQFDAAIVGTVDVTLLERSAGRPQVDLLPRNGGVTAVVRVPNVRIRHDISFSCLVTTCGGTGTATADAVVVTVTIDMALREGALTATSSGASIDLVGFRNEQDGTLLQGVLDLFVPDLEARLEQLLQPAVEQAASADFALAVGALRVPQTVDLAPLDAQLELAQEFDALDFSDTGAIVALGVRARGVFAEGDPGAGAPGWFKWGGGLGDYRLEPAFAVSSSVDLANQTLFAMWGQGALVYDIPEGTLDVGSTSIGVVHVSTTAPPVVIPDAEGGALRGAAGDVLLDTTVDGAPLKIMCSVVGRVQISVDLPSNLLKIELAENPVIYAEMIEGPDDLPGGFFSSLVEQLAPESLATIVGSIPLQLPVLPLDGVAPTMAGRTLKLAPPAEVVSGEPQGRVTLYGRLVAQ